MTGVGIGGRDLASAGDFPAFYGAGAVVRDGLTDQLYDPAIQIDGQRGINGEHEPGSLYFAYPPIVALPFAQLARLPYRGAYVLYTLALLSCMLASITLGWKRSRVASKGLSALICACFMFSPVWKPVVGAQLTPALFLVLVLYLRNLENDDSSEWALSLLLFLALWKPQFGVPLIGLTLLSRTTRNTRATIAACSAFWLANAAFFGANWFGTWLRIVLDYQSSPEIGESPLSISWLGVLTGVLGSDSAPAQVAGWLLIALTVAILIAAWRPAAQLDPRARIAIFVPGVLLLSPHTTFLDGALLLIPLLIAAEERRLSMRMLIGLALLSVVDLLGLPTLIHPNFVIVVGVFAAETWRQRTVVLPKFALKVGSLA